MGTFYYNQLSQFDHASEVAAIKKTFNEQGSAVGAAAIRQRCSMT